MPRKNRGWGRIAAGLVAAGVLVSAAVYAAPDGTSPVADSVLIRLSAPATPPAVSPADRAGWQAVELPYQGGDLAMDLLLPDSGDFAGRSAALTASGLDLGSIPADHEQLSVSQVTQLTRIAVTEQGTTAAAATAVGGEALTASAEAPLSLSFDRPFLFLIRDVTTGRTLFLGQVTDPTA